MRLWQLEEISRRVADRLDGTLMRFQSQWGLVCGNPQLVLAESKAWSAEKSGEVAASALTTFGLGKCGSPCLQLNKNVVEKSILAAPLTADEKRILLQQLKDNQFEVRIFGAADTIWDAQGSIVKRLMTELKIPAANIKIENIPGI